MQVRGRRERIAGSLGIRERPRVSMEAAARGHAPGPDRGRVGGRRSSGLRRRRAGDSSSSSPPGCAAGRGFPNSPGSSRRGRYRSTRPVVARSWPHLWHMATAPMPGPIPRTTIHATGSIRHVATDRIARSPRRRRRASCRRSTLWNLRQHRSTISQQTEDIGYREPSHRPIMAPQVLHHRVPRGCHSATVAMSPTQSSSR